MFELLGFLRKSSMSCHMFFAHVPWRSSRLNTNPVALTRALASACVTLSGYELEGTLLFGDANPPRCAQMDAPCGPARYLISASDWGVSLSMMATSPAPWTAPWLALSAAGAGKSKKL